jgi:hypothetical protein
MVGRAPLILVSSVMLKFASNGTLKSTLISAFLSLNGRFMILALQLLFLVLAID